jgi:hypothetical protein
MMTVFLILIVLVIAGAVTFFLMKKGKIEDKNGNNIPDVVEEKIEDVSESDVKLNFCVTPDEIFSFTN